MTQTPTDPSMAHEQSTHHSLNDAQSRKEFTTQDILASDLSQTIGLVDSKHYINRELSWLEFNRRVLQEAL
ncbi:MAG: hypothetical protein AAFQ57_00410, partial [Cyanobacteria bacterium J06626_14]